MIELCEKCKTNFVKCRLINPPECHLMWVCIKCEYEIYDLINDKDNEALDLIFKERKSVMQVLEDDLPEGWAEHLDLGVPLPQQQ